MRCITCVHFIIFNIGEPRLFDAIQQCRVDCHDVLVLGTRVAISDSVLS